MIKILTTQGRTAAIFHCDGCGEKIVNPDMAMALYVDDPPEGETGEVLHAHKGACDQKLQARIGKKGGWAEFKHHVVDLVHNSGLPPTKLVEIEADMHGPLGIRNF